MAKVSKVKAVATSAVMAGLLVGTVAPSHAAALWGERFSSLRGAQSQSVGGGWKLSLIQYRAFKYDQRISKFLGRSASPFCRFFC